MILLFVEGLHHILPFREDGRDHKVTVVNPVSVGSVAVRGVSVKISRYHVVFILFHLGSRGRKRLPVRHEFLHGVRIVRSKHFFGNGSAINEYTGRRLPCHSFQYTLIGGSHLLRISELVFQFFIRKTNLLSHIQRVVAVDIDRQILFRRQIEVDPLIVAQIFRTQQFFGDHVHVPAVLRNDPVDDHVSDPSRSVAQVFITRIIHDEQRFQRFIPAADVEMLAFAPPSLFFRRKRLCRRFLCACLFCIKVCGACSCRIRGGCVFCLAAGQSRHFYPESVKYSRYRAAAGTAHRDHCRKCDSCKSLSKSLHCNPLYGQ